jgi:hypothetical protein
MKLVATDYYRLGILWFLLLISVIGAADQEKIVAKSPPSAASSGPISIEKLIEEHKHAIDKNERLQIELTQAKEKIKQHEDVILIQGKDNEKLQIEFDHAKDKIKQHEHVIHSQVKNNDELQIELNRAKDKIKQHEHAIHSQGKNNEELQIELTQTRNQRDQYLNEKISLEEQLEQENIIPTFCQSLVSHFKESLDPLPIADWLNFSNLPSFYEPIVRSLMSKEEYFNAIDALGQYNFAIQPYGFHSGYKLQNKSFELTSYGILATGGLTFKDNWVVGGGVAYSYSHLGWGNRAKNNRIHSLYFGPYLAFVHNQTYIDLTLLGVYNRYHAHQVLEMKIPLKHQHEGWNVGARLKGGIDLETFGLFGKHSFIQPNVDLSYLIDLDPKHENTHTVNDDNVVISVNNRHASFFRSKLAVDFWKEFYRQERGFWIPHLSLGWVLMQPLSHSKMLLKCGDGDEKAISDKGYPNSNQLYVGVKLQRIFKRGLLVSLAFDAYIAKLYPVYMGDLRLEWDW